MGHRRDIQGLRAVAILLVVLAHAGVPGFAGGFIGVDVFFVLSGYLITGLLLRERESTGDIRLAAFYARRLKRLLPALAVMLAGTLLVAPLLLTPAELDAQTGSARFAATWTSNVYFAFANIDYFAELETRDLFLHTWSLAVEEQFYLAWAPLLLLITRGLGAEPAGRRRRLLKVLAAVLGGGLVLYGAGVALDPVRTFYMMPARIWQFALGALTWVAFGPVAGAKQRWADAAGWAGLALVVGSALSLEATRASAWLAAPSLGAALLIAGGCGRASISGWLSHRVPVWIGDRSYSWYLWHWPVLMIGASFGVSGAGVVALVLCSLALASLSYGLVELPLWKGRRANAAAPRLVNLAAVLVMAAFVAIPARVVELPVASTSKVAAGPDTCDDWYRSAAVRPCRYGPPEAGKTVVLIGDSIGAQWLPLVAAALPAPAWRLELLTKSGCPIVDEDFVYERIGKVYAVCRAWRDAVLAYVAELRPQVVVIGSSVQYPFSRDQWIGGSRRVLARLTAAAGHAVVIPGTPGLSFHGPQCLEQNARAAERLIGVPRSCGEPWKDGAATDVAGYLREALQPFPRASLLDLNDRVCPSRWCRADTPDGLVVFRDSRHLTGEFARTLAPFLGAHLASRGVDAAAH
jgi:peptidoglycan/LPS O-acetylase OafA/YrhL